ncbi:hypothetical protein [Cohnella silvisoli]|uniref:Uncharacterized protein n=1 Tax=Cohnella silvisoli TaxID=2873699 RepID=A0ABV1KMM6_9BACL|nr:hypothetical protein [Cohnella silvisoli]MCD9020388.1 hypothetical protein [Cohnella silvisoli]
MIGIGEERITSIQLYQFDDPHNLPNGACVKEDCSCRYGLLRITCCGHIGWSECVLTENTVSFDLVTWSSFLHNFKKPTLKEAYETVDLFQYKWGTTKAELVRAALNDIAAQLHHDNLQEQRVTATRSSAVCAAGGSRTKRNVSSPSLSIGSNHSVVPLDTASLIESCRSYYEIL